MLRPLLLLLALPLLAVACGDPVATDPPRTPDPVIPGGEVIEDGIVSEAATFRLVRVASGLSNPWGLAFLPDGRMLVTERAGRMHLVENGRLSSLSGLPAIAAQGQGGLLDVQLHPDYEANGWIYFTYSEPGDGGAGTALARARLDGTALTDLEVLYTQARKTGRGQHFGSRIGFLADGTVLFTIGDRGEMERAQDLRDSAGSTIRLTEDGGIPPDNPFVGRDDVRPELYTVGNRNSQGMAIHPETGEVWQTEHGPRGGDELNLIRPGLNYGWPTVSEGADYRTQEPIGVPHSRHPEFEPPVEVWTPSIAPSGTAFYLGDAFPGWRGNLFVGALVFQQVRRVELSGGRVTHQEVLLEGRIGRIRYVTVGPDGYVYLLNDEGQAGIYRLEPSDA
jgi:aldose sugar dehydrogenase